MTSSRDIKKHDVVSVDDDSLFKRITTILEQARANVVRSVNSNMVLAYWLIGREIIEEAQAGAERAEYGKQVIEKLSGQLTDTYGKGFSVANLKLFRQFYQAFHGRLKIDYPAGSFLSGELDTRQGANSAAILSQPESELPVAAGRPFDPNLSWSHYRALMRVSKLEARDFYEQETVECGWTKVQLERQIQTSYYERIIQNKGSDGLLPANRERLPGDPVPPVNILKSPYVLEFLDLPDSPDLHESDLEQAIINNLQSFLLEMGKGFSFVARQKKIHFDGDNFYIDLVFYNFVLTCFLLIDLKIGKLSHRDVGQMDGYVRLFEDRFKVEGDNPTIGLILCSDKSEAVARYSVLNEGKQIFASKYLQFLPSEEELKIEIEKERNLIERAMDNGDFKIDNE